MSTPCPSHSPGNVAHPPQELLPAPDWTRAARWGAAALSPNSGLKGPEEALHAADCSRRPQELPTTLAPQEPQPPASCPAHHGQGHEDPPTPRCVGDQGGCSGAPGPCRAQMEPYSDEQRLVSGERSLSSTGRDSVGFIFLSPVDGQEEKAPGSAGLTQGTAPSAPPSALCEVPGGQGRPALLSGPAWWGLMMPRGKFKLRPLPPAPPRPGPARLPGGHCTVNTEPAC